MVFGVFDIIHDGHRHFLREAKKLGQKLITVLPPDSAVRALKGHLPYHTLAERIKNLERESLADDIVRGDDILGNWTGINTKRPDIIALGYDQQKLGEALQSARGKIPPNIEIVSIAPHKNTSLHSEALRKKM